MGYKKVAPKRNIDSSNSDFSTKKPYDPSKHQLSPLPDGEYSGEQITARLEKNAAEITAAVYAADDPVMSTPLTAYGKSSNPVVKIPAPAYFESKDVNIGRSAQSEE
jgi:hypothetical protein